MKIVSPPMSIFIKCVLVCMCVIPLHVGRSFFGSARLTCGPLSGEVCVKIRECPFFDNLLNRTAKPRPRSVIKIIREYQCGFDGSTPFVCCQKPTPPPETTTETGTIPTPVLGKSNNVLTRHKNYKLLPNDICGPISTNSRITSGMKTAIGEYPWMALIVYNTEDGLDFKCGGTVLNERYVLTAAHCILNSTIVGVRLGEHNLDTIKDCEPMGDYCAPPTQDFYIENIIVHPGYHSNTLVNDIALIRLATPANFSYSNVQPICLPMDDVDLSGRWAFVSGWGVTETGYKSMELLKVAIPVLPIVKCQQKYKRFAPITTNQICAGGYKGKDSCGGDSGGPMQYLDIVDGNPKFIQYGIVSYGPRQCGTKGQPGIYTRVSRYVLWILDNLEPETDPT